MRPRPLCVLSLAASLVTALGAEASARGNDPGAPPPAAATGLPAPASLSDGPALLTQYCVTFPTEACADDASIELRDLNGDGAPEVVYVNGGTWGVRIAAWEGAGWRIVLDYEGGLGRPDVLDGGTVGTGWRELSIRGDDVDCVTETYYRFDGSVYVAYRVEERGDC